MAEATGIACHVKFWVIGRQAAIMFVTVAPTLWWQHLRLQLIVLINADQLMSHGSGMHAARSNNNAG